MAARRAGRSQAPPELSERQRYWLKHIRAAERKREPLKHYAKRRGELDLVTRPDGLEIDPQYDGAGRLETLVRPAGNTSFLYDDVDTDGDPATGKLEQITAPGPEVLTFSYDGFLLEDSVWSGTIGGTVMRDYDSFLRLSGEQVVTHDADFLPYQYDDDGLLSLAGALSITRDPHGGDANGLIATTTLSNIGTVHTYNPFGELATLTAGTLYSEDVSQRDDLGRITRKVETISGVPTTTDYTYDPDTGRLETVTLNGAPTPSRHYRYDANGNRLSFDPLDATQIAFYDAQDRLTSYGTTTYTYTANGELETKTQNGTDLTRYTYATLGNLTQVILPDDRTISYAIDGRNRRVGKKLDGVLVQGFLYRDALNPVAELNAAGTVVSRFVYGTKPHVPDYMSSSGGIFRILSDHLGSVRLVVDASSGVVRQRIDYDQFGQITLREEYDAAGLLLPAGTPPFQPFGFAGGLYDPDTGLVRFGARDYDPEVGRWTAKDPIRFAGGDPNLYEYTFSDPVNFTDPSGRIIPLLAFIGAATGGFQAANAAEDLGLTGFNKAAAIAFGAATGGAAGVAPGLAGISGPLAGVAASAFAGAIGGASGDAAAQLLAGSSNSCSVIESAKEGALSGLIGGGVSGLLGNTPAGQLAGALATSAAALFLDQTDPPPTR